MQEVRMDILVEKKYSLKKAIKKGMRGPLTSTCFCDFSSWKKSIIIPNRKVQTFQIRKQEQAHKQVKLKGHVKEPKEIAAGLFDDVRTKESPSLVKTHKEETCCHWTLRNLGRITLWYLTLFVVKICQIFNPIFFGFFDVFLKFYFFVCLFLVTYLESLNFPIRHDDRFF